MNLSNMSLDFIGRITSQDIDMFLQWLSDRGNSTSTKSRRIYSLKSFFSYLKENNLIKTNSMDKKSAPKVKFREEAYLDEEESIMLLEIVKNNCKTLRDYCIIHMILNMGLRNMEARNVKISDINFKTNELTIIGKGEKEDILKIPKSTMELVKEWLQERDEKYIKTGNIQEGYEDFLYLTHQGKILEERSLGLLVRKYYKLAKFGKEGLCVHSLRHSFITRMYESTKDMERTRKLARHSKIATTQRYIHTNEESTNQTIEEFSL